MNALEELRAIIEEHWPHSDPGWREGQMTFAPTIDAIADRIEAEYMEMPKDADGVPCRYWNKVVSEDGVFGTVKAVGKSRLHVRTPDSGRWFSVDAGTCHHVRPEPPDSQERIDQDAGKGPCEYFGHDCMPCGDGGECRAASSHDSCYTCQRIDLLRRQRELDGRKHERK